MGYISDKLKLFSCIYFFVVLMVMLGELVNISVKMVNTAVNKGTAAAL